MRHSLLVAVALTGCAHEATFGGGSHGVVSYGGGGGGYSSGVSASSSSSATSTSSSSATKTTSSSAMSVSSSSSHSGAPESHDVTSGDVHHSNATGAPLSAVSNGATELKQSDGKAGGPHTENKLLKAGLITLGIAYVSTVVTAQVMDATLIGDFENAVGAQGVISRLWIPVLGPFSAIIYNETTVADNCSDPTILMQYPGFSCNLREPSTLLILGGGIAQAIGFGMTMQALLKPPSPAKHSEKQLVIVPHGGPTSAGITLSGSF